MTPLATLLWIANVALDTCGQLSFKVAAVKETEEDGLARWKSMLSDFWIWLGIGSYAIEFFLWLAFLTIVPLSQATLMGCVNILAVMIAGRVFFGEALTTKRVVATLLITVGVALVGWG